MTPASSLACWSFPFLSRILRGMLATKDYHTEDQKVATVRVSMSMADYTMTPENEERGPEMPPQCDRLTESRYVRGYVLGDKRPSSSGTSIGGTGSATTRERKALLLWGVKAVRKPQNDGTTPTAITRKPNSRSCAKWMNERRSGVDPPEVSLTCDRRV